MQSKRRLLRALVVTAAFIPLLGMRPAPASVGWCYPGWDKHDVSVDGTTTPFKILAADVDTAGGTLQACIGYASLRVGVFFTPSATSATVTGDDVTMKVGGGVCYYESYLDGYPHHRACVNDPSLTVQSASFANAAGGGAAAGADATVTPCSGTSTWGSASYPMINTGWGYLSAACVVATNGATVSAGPGGASVTVVPGLCVSVNSGYQYVCFTLRSYTTTTGGTVPVFDQTVHVCPSAKLSYSPTASGCLVQTTI